MSSNVPHVTWGIESNGLINQKCVLTHVPLQLPKYLVNYLKQYSDTAVVYNGYIHVLSMDKTSYVMYQPYTAIEAQEPLELDLKAAYRTKEVTIPGPLTRKYEYDVAIYNELVKTLPHGTPKWVEVYQDSIEKMHALFKLLSLYYANAGVAVLDDRVIIKHADADHELSFAFGPGITALTDADVKYTYRAEALASATNLAGVDKAWVGVDDMGLLMFEYWKEDGRIKVFIAPA